MPNENEKHPLEHIAEAVGGTIEEMGALPDGSGFAIMSMPLKKDHWIYDKGPENFNTPPMPLRMHAVEFVEMNFQEPGRFRTLRVSRQQLSNIIREAGKYAVRCATMNGSDMDFDPDALLQNLVVGFLGYHTENGLSDEDWANPPHLRHAER